MSVNGVSSNTFGSYAKRIGRIYLHTTFGTGADEFWESMNNSIFDKKAPWYAPYRNANFKNFGDKFKQAYQSVEAHEAAIRKANGNSYLKAFWHQFTTIPKVFQDEWRLGGEVAKRAGKSVAAGKARGVFKALMKRFPMIGGLLAVGFQLPNIISAFTSKDGGVATGLLETGKAAAKIGIDTAGFMIGQALIPIPLVGGIIGSMVAGALGEAVLGKGFAEKQTAKNGESHLPGWMPYVAQNDGNGQQIHESGAYGWTPPQPAMTDEQLLQMAQYMNSGGGLNYLYG